MTIERARDAGAAAASRSSPRPPSCSPPAASTASRSPTSVPRAASAARRSTSTSSPRTPCWPRCWSRSARSCSRGQRPGRPPRRDPAAAVGGAGRLARRLRAAPPPADRRAGPRLGVAARPRRASGCAPCSGSTSTSGPASSARSTRGARAPDPAPRGDGARGVRADQLHPAQRPAAGRGHARRCCAGWRSARSASRACAQPSSPASRRQRCGRLRRGGRASRPGRRGSARMRAARSAASRPVSRSSRRSRLRPGRARRPVGRGVPGVQPGQQLVARQPAQLEQHERVGLDQPGQLVEHGQRVRRTGRPRPSQVHVGGQLAAVGQQLDAGLLGVLDQRVRQVAGEQRGDPAGLGGDRLDQRLAGRSRRAPARVPDTVQSPSSSSTAATKRPASVVILPDVARRGPACAPARRSRLGVRRLLDRAHPRLAPPRSWPGRAPRRGRIRGWTTALIRGLVGVRPARGAGDQVAQLVVARARSARPRRGPAPRRPARACG